METKGRTLFFDLGEAQELVQWLERQEASDSVRNEYVSPYLVRGLAEALRTGRQIRVRRAAP